MIGNHLEPFKFWCQKVLPNVYDDSLSYYEYLCKLNEYLNEVIGQINTLTDNMEDYEEDLTATWLETKEYIDNYFNNLDVQEEINNKLDHMASSGALSALLAPVVGTQIGGVVAQQIGGTVAQQIDGAVAEQIDDSVASQISTPVANATADWLSSHIEPTSPVIDDTLSISGAGADSLVVGTKLKEFDTEINDIFSLINNANPTFTYKQGYYDGSMNYVSGATTQITTDVMKLPKGLKVTLYHTPGNIVVLREFQYINGAWQRTVNKAISNTDNITIGSSEYLYCFGLSSGSNVLPSEGSNITFTYDYELKNLYTAPYTKEPTSTDCNDIRDNGIYPVLATSQNLPSGIIQNGTMFVYGPTVFRKVQIFTETGNTTLWYRISIDNTSWGAWLKLINDATLNDILTNPTRTLFIDNNIVANGISNFTTLEVGAYVANMAWDTNQTHQASVPYVITDCEGIVLRGISKLNGVQVYIKEFKYENGSYIRTNVINGYNVSYKCLKDRLYNIALYDAVNAFVTAPTNGFYFYAYSDKITSGYYIYNSTAKELEILTNRTRYVIKKQVNNTIHLDSWRLYEGDILVNGYWSTMWVNSDAEGPIKIDNEADFISGFHGDEIVDNATIYIDNTTLDITTDSFGLFNSIMLYQESTVYKCDSEDEAFTRYKRVRIDKNGYDVQQKWVSKINCTINRGALCLMQCYKTSLIGWDTDILIPMQTPSQYATLSKDTRVGNYYLSDGSKMSLIVEYGADNQYFTPTSNNFADQNRNKYYFDMYNGMSVSIGDEINSKFRVTID